MDWNLLAIISYWIGCGLSFLSYAVRDMLQLRILAIFNCLFVIPYYLVLDKIAIEPIIMTLIIVLINVVNLVLLLNSMKPPVMDEFQKRLHKEYLNRMNPRNMLKLLKIAEVTQAPTGTTLIAEGEENCHVYLIYKGEAIVKLDDQILAHLQAGRFMGEMTFVTELNGASAHVETSQDSEIISFSFDKLKELEQKEPETYSQFFSTLTIDLARKVLDNSKVRTIYASQ